MKIKLGWKWVLINVSSMNRFGTLGPYKVDNFDVKIE